MCAFYQLLSERLWYTIEDSDELFFHGSRQKQTQKRNKNVMDTRTQKEVQSKIKQPLWSKTVFFTCFFLGVVAIIAGFLTTNNTRLFALATGCFLVGVIFLIAGRRQAQTR